ncbi:short chain dehydrogenase reductase family, putative [Ichthyophthirius multifiliis]|uniref:Short chain dehydrogenase reductase family, putative n=1 Tax=Ichthyophthirius multifiliis TaxID=5932 RepID=G0QSE0_ICHMU|nr:short chain dehydrogenase reductase family, putative [Ichthyophthirius multifiliis]EGR31887.1 short chain dehydrogenase reductase family, putative [Ichthyophthirius multifiliis]|eukprot:XP_004035373.1 short chain dehydrogenase reductase family, putative [Ichthyophthirius multifiliis]
MSDFDSIKNFVEEYQKLNVPLNALVHNAGTMNKDKQLTKQNIEYNFATNVAGVALMTEKFIPLMEKTSQTAEDKAKVVLVSSGGIQFYSMHPGWVRYTCITCSYARVLQKIQKCTQRRILF